MWERTLEFYLQQNAFLKIKLSQVLDGMKGKHFLSEAEHFHNAFIQNDENIKDLQNDIELLHGFMKDGTMDAAKLESKYCKLNNELNNFEKNFSILRSDFRKYWQL